MGFGLVVEDDVLLGFCFVGVDVFFLFVFGVLVFFLFVFGNGCCCCWCGGGIVVELFFLDLVWVVLFKLILRCDGDMWVVWCGVGVV